MSSLSFATYNSHGSGTDRIEYIQEHWLLDSRISSLEDKINDVHVHGKLGMLESDRKSGRPFGGVAIIWKKNIK